MTMATLSDYLALLPSAHAAQPKFTAMIEAVVGPLADAGAAAGSLPAAFDLDAAVGAQLDAIGLWVGVSRRVSQPLSGVYFSLDVPALGFDHGVWKGPYDGAGGIVEIGDPAYRTLIRAKIGANRWDGTMTQLKALLDMVFDPGTHVIVQDNQDMTMTVGVAGAQPSALQLAILTNGYIPLKPVGVGSRYLITSQDGAPIFGFDMQNSYVSGFDAGALAVAI